MNEIKLKKVCNYHIYPRDSQITTDKGFLNIDNGAQGGTRWVCYYMKDNKSFNFDSFRRPSDKFLLNQLPKPITLHNYKIEDKNSRLCATYRLYFFYLIERMDYYDAI